ncbi:MAG: hypothetical protein ACFB0B_20740 [Thermonemataceae bacterium]
MTDSKINYEAELEIANGKLYKAYKRINNLETFDLRAFEYFDGKKQFTKVAPLLRALNFAELTAEEQKAKNLIEKSNVSKIENGLEFVKELLRK